MQNLHKERTDHSNEEGVPAKERLFRILAVMAKVPAIDDVPIHDEAVMVPPSRLYAEGFD